MDRCNNSCESSQRRERVREERVSRKKVRDGQSQRRESKKKINMPEKVEKSRNTAFFPMPCGSGGSKNGLAEAAGAWPSSRVRDQKLHAAAARSTFRSQIEKKKRLILGARLEVELG